MAWAKSVPLGARYDLTASGVADTLGGADRGSQFEQTFTMQELSRRDCSARAHAEFLETVAERYGCPASRVTATLGASLAITHAVIALIRAGDHVVVERPTYEALHRTPEILGARVSRLERRFDEGWKVVPDRLAQLLTSRTRAVILSNLHNPSGVAVDAKTLGHVAELAARVGAVVLVDEVYLDHRFQTGEQAEIRPAATIAPNCVSWSSSTKVFGFSALRTGWIVAGNDDVARAIRLATDYLHVHAPVATTMLGTRVLKAAAELEAAAAGQAARGREIVETWLQSEARVSWVPPTAGITGCLRLPHFLQDLPFAEHLRGRYDTQVVPGAMFECPGYIRVSFGIEPGDLQQGLANLSSALDDLS